MTMGAHFEPVNEGAIWAEPDSSRLTPVGEVFVLFRPHQGGRIIEIESPPADPELDIAASIDEARSEVPITAVNRSCEQEHDVEFTLKSAGNTVAAMGTVLTCPDFLPGTAFTRKEMDITSRGERAFAVSVPGHSVARIQVSLG